MTSGKSPLAPPIEAIVERRMRPVANFGAFPNVEFKLKLDDNSELRYGSGERIGGDRRGHLSNALHHF